MRTQISLQPPAAALTAMRQARLATPFGEIALYATAAGLSRVLLPGEASPALERMPPARASDGAPNDGDALLHEACAQLSAYFAGNRRAFDLPLDLRGTAFQRQVWSAVSAIPYSKTQSYQQIARVIERPAAVRAVGAANGANPLPIIIPCHRVIGANGSLTGYGGGLEMKQRLLTLERSAT